MSARPPVVSCGRLDIYPVSGHVNRPQMGAHRDPKMGKCQVTPLVVSEDIGEARPMDARTHPAAQLETVGRLLGHHLQSVVVMAFAHFRPLSRALSGHSREP